jgi:hypothetical protein
MQMVDALVISLVVVAVAAVKIARGPFGEAMADRLRGAAPPDPGLQAELDAVKARLAEVEERLDFAERLLAQAEQPERLSRRSDS